MTPSEINDLQSGVLWDKGEGSVKGLHVKVQRSGKKSFFLFYRNKKGVQRRPKLGDVGIELNLVAARKVARAMWEEIALGGDPSKYRMSVRDEPTIKEMFDIALAEHWSDKRYETSGFRKEVEWNFERNIKPTFGSLKLSEVTAPLVHDWHRSLKSTPYAANRSKSVLSTVLKLAELKGFKPVGSNPCSVVPNFAEKSRERSATAEEITKIYSILNREMESNLKASTFIMLLMLTGSRPSAIERAKWSDIIDIEIAGVLHKALAIDGKSGREVIVLPPQAVAVIDKLPRFGEKILGINMPRKFWVRIRKEAGCEDLWARDWRRTFATQGLSMGLSIDQIGRTLNHKTQQTTLVYARLQDRVRVDTATRIADRIESIGSGDN